jgi:hypothetical protein
VNIPAHFSAIVERFVGELVLDPKDADFIGNQKNGYYALIVGSLRLLLVADAQIMLEAIMLPNTIIDFDQKVFNQRCKKDFD